MPGLHSKKLPFFVAISFHHTQYPVNRQGKQTQRYDQQPVIDGRKPMPDSHIKINTGIKHNKQPDNPLSIQHF